MNDPHCLCTMGLGSGDYNNLAFDDSDLVIAVGYDLVECSPEAWNRTSARDKKNAHVDFYPTEVGRDYPTTVEIVSDLADVLWQINEALNEHYTGRLQLFDIAERVPLRGLMTEDFAAEKNDDSFSAKPQRIVWDVRNVLGPDDILLSDAGTHKMWIWDTFDVIPRTRVSFSTAFLPGASPCLVR